jgi:type IV pilus assembly protein PilM
MIKKLFGGIKWTEQPTIGLDIGSYAIKMVELSGSPGSEPHNQTLRRIGMARVPAGVISEGSIKEYNILLDIISSLLANLQPKNKRVTSSISGYSVIVKKITLGYKTEKEIEDNLALEAENYIPFDIQDVFMDFHMLKQGATEKTTDIFLAAAKKDIVNLYANLIQDLGYTPSIIDVDTFALNNALEVSVAGKPDALNVIGIIDMGATKSNLVISIEGEPVFMRDMAIGGNQLTEAIAESTGMSFDDAERIKLTGTADSGLAGEISLICMDVCQVWSEEIRKALEFYQANTISSQVPKKLFLTGGTAMLNGLTQKIAEAVGVETVLFDPFEDFALDKAINPRYVQTIAPQFAVALGLALRTVER